MLYALKVLNGIIQLLAKFLQPAKCIDKDAPCTDRRSGNQRMMIEFPLTDYQLFDCVKKSKSFISLTLISTYLICIELFESYEVIHTVFHNFKEHMFIRHVFICLK